MPRMIYSLTTLVEDSQELQLLRIVIACRLAHQSLTMQRSHRQSLIGRKCLMPTKVRSRNFLGMLYKTLSLNTRIQLLYIPVDGHQHDSIASIDFLQGKTVHHFTSFRTLRSNRFSRQLRWSSGSLYGRFTAQHCRNVLLLYIEIGLQSEIAAGTQANHYTKATIWGVTSATVVQSSDYFSG